MKKNLFFFESLEGDKNWSRYTIIGCSSGDFIEIFGNKIKKFNNFKLENEFNHDKPLRWLEDYFLSYKVFIAKNLPSFCGGFVGHFSFESVCFFEESVIRKKQFNDLDTPDISLIICKEFIVFDKVNNKIFIVVFSDDSESGYKASQNKINQYETLLNKELTKKEPKKSSKDMIIVNDFKKNDFLKAVKDIKKYIISGDVMQVVLSQRMTIDFNEKPIDFYRELRKINPSPYMYYLNMGDYTVVGSSPEILARLENKIGRAHV